MNRKWEFFLPVVMALAIAAAGCSKSSAPTQPQQQQPPAPKLVAVPPSASVGVGTSQTIIISGGTPPYAIGSAPSAIATAQLLNPDSMIVSLQITGVTVASVSTAVTVNDHTLSQVKSVTVPIQVR